MDGQSFIVQADDSIVELKNFFYRALVRLEME